MTSWKEGEREVGNPLDRSTYGRMEGKKDLLRALPPSAAIRIFLPMAS